MINVVIPVYNVEKYLKDCMESVLAQTYTDFQVVLVDDGSTDGTPALLRRFEADDPRVIVFPEENIGVGSSFMSLVYRVPQRYDFYAFSDQDDVWLDRKLITAAERIGDDSTPVLYASNQTLTDEALRVIGRRYDRPPDTGYRQIICQNRISGCTMVWNPALQEILADENRRPSPALLGQ